MPMTKEQKVVAKARTARVRDLLAKTNLLITEGDPVAAFSAAEEAYEAAFEAKDYLGRVAFAEETVRVFEPATT